MNQTFSFKPSEFVPFQDQKEIERVKNLTREEYLNHSNPNLKIHIVPNDMLNTILVADMLNTIIKAKEEGRNAVMIIPNPSPSYKHLAMMINTLGIDCKHVITFNMDEWADDRGNIADENYPQSFIRSTKEFLFSNINPELRMPEENIKYPTTENISYYSDLILEAGGADVCYSGPGWSGHLAFIDPDVPEFAADSIDELMQYGARVTTLHPLTIAQNSLHGSFGASGDIANVPPKAATIGPKDVAAAKRRVEMHGITTAGSHVTWQRMISRLVLHGPVTPKLPTSIMQVLGADVYVTENLAAPIVPDFEFQY